MSTRRLFVSVALPDRIRAVLQALMRPSPAIRWTPLGQLHVTLRFLGDVDAERTEALLKRFATIRVEPFIVPLEGVGSFPPKAPPRVVWTGLGNGHPRLFQLRQKIDDAVIAAGLDADLRRFHPHVTLGRCSETAQGEAQRWLREHRDFAGPPFLVDGFDLCASELLPDGAHHELVARFSLSPSSTDPSGTA